MKKKLVGIRLGKRKRLNESRDSFVGFLCVALELTPNQAGLKFGDPPASVKEICSLETNLRYDRTILNSSLLILTPKEVCNIMTGMC